MDTEEVKMKEDEQLVMISKTIEWLKTARLAIEKAGGFPDYVIDQCPTALLNTLIRNNLHFVYIPE